MPGAATAVPLLFRQVAQSLCAEVCQRGVATLTHSALAYALRHFHDTLKNWRLGVCILLVQPVSRVKVNNKDGC